jgi:hypothetical protein
MTREEIIAHLETEINLLLRARDVLSTPLSDFMKVAPRKAKSKPVEKVRVEAPVVAAPVAVQTPLPLLPAVAAEMTVQVNQPHQVHRVPARRRMERRQSPDKQARSSAALSGQVPAGPVAVSAVEARKVQDRPVVVAPPPAAVELRPEAANERSLGSLIQAFERRSGLSGLEIP